MRALLFLLTATLLCNASLLAADGQKVFTVGNLSFAKPETWTWVEIQPGMRAAQLEIKGENGEKGEVLFFHFPGGGGGVQANIDRWLGMFQEGKDKINARTEKVAAEKGTITYVQADGTYMSGMPGGPKTPQAGYMLHGAIIENPEANVFIRLTGPIRLAKSARDDFRAMVENALK
jgi:hypothetical protein